MLRIGAITLAVASVLAPRAVRAQRETYRLTPRWRTEVGFLEHVIFKSNGTDVERNHTATVALSYSRVAPRPVGVTPSR